MFHARAVDMLRSAESGLNELNAPSLGPVGALRVCMPAFLSTSQLANSIAVFVRPHPQVALSLILTDQRLDLLNDGFDVNIRVGRLDDSSMVSRKLGSSERAGGRGVLRRHTAHAETSIRLGGLELDPLPQPTPHQPRISSWQERVLTTAPLDNVDMGQGVYAFRRIGRSHAGHSQRPLRFDPPCRACRSLGRG